MSSREYKFKIDTFTLDTLPMARLAEYMTDLAVVLGQPEKVHFVRLEPGSVTLVQMVDAEVEPEVRIRAKASKAGEGPSEAVKAYRRLNRRLLDDNATGILNDDSDTNVVEFPGRKQAEPNTFGPFNQDGSLDGVVIRVGGVRDFVPITLETTDQQYTRCHANRETAKALAQHIFGPEIRVFGKGRWSRDRLGAWTLDRFVVGRFEILGEEPLSTVLARLRDVPGSEWPKSSDPWDELRKQRGLSSETH